jgi:hypothetical protein
MPGLNPYYWVVCGLVLAVSASAGVIVGFAVFGATCFFLRRNRLAREIGLPVGVLAGILAFCLAFPWLVTWVSRDPARPVVEPPRSELIGTWMVTPDALRRMRDVGGYAISTHSLTLHDDGKLEYVNLPDWWQDFGDSHQQLFSGTGQWRLVNNLNSRGYWEVEVSLHGWMTNTIVIAQNRSGYYLYAVIGDPDSGHTMMFEKP